MAAVRSMYFLQAHFKHYPVSNKLFNLTQFKVKQTSKTLESTFLMTLSDLVDGNRLHLACRDGNISMVKQLLDERDRKIDEKNEEG